MTTLDTLLSGSFLPTNGVRPSPVSRPDYGHEIFDSLAEVDPAASMSWAMRAEPARIASGAVVPDCQAIVRTDTGVPLAAVGSRYSIIQPGELVNIARAVLERTGGKFVGSRVIDGGRRVAVTLATTKAAAMRGKDASLMLVRLSAHNDGGGAVQGEVFAWRPYCRNQLPVAVRLASGMSSDGSGRARRVACVSIRHTKSGAELARDADRVAGMLAPAAAEADAFAGGLMAAELTVGQIAAFFQAVLPEPAAPDDASMDARKRHERRCRRIREAQDRMRGILRADMATHDVRTPNAWSALNAVTRWAQHEAKVKGGADGRFSANLPGGSGHRMTLQAVDTAREMFL